MPSAAPPTAPTPTRHTAWLMLLALCTAFMLSQSYRTAAAILAPELQARLGFTPQQLGVFATVSGAAMGIGGVGMLLTGTPLAWLVHDQSLRAGFLMLAALSALAWTTIYFYVREPAAPAASGPHPAVWQAIRQFGQLLRLPQTLGIMALGAVTYACFITLRGLWLGPLLVERFHYSLIESGHVALAVSLVSLLGPPFFGRHDPGPVRRRRWIIGYTLLMATLFVLLALTRWPWAAGAVLVAISFLVGFPVLQYADVRAAYPEAQTGRAMAAFTMAMFLGIALMQWFSGLVAQAARGGDVDPYTAVLLAVAALLLAGAAAFAWLPAPHVPRR